MTVIITMAGRGERFRRAGYDLPKYKIMAHDKSLLEWSLSSLQNFRHLEHIFLTLAEDPNTDFVYSVCQTLDIQRYQIHPLDQPTSGQAETALAAKEYFTDPSEAILIYNIDTYVEPQALTPNMIQGAAWLPAFEADGDQWSFVNFDEDMIVNAVTEKRRISKYGTIGLYYFESFELFQHCYKVCNFDTYSERYIAPMYQVLIDDSSCEVHTSILPQDLIHVLGTPEDLAAFRVN